MKKKRLAFLAFLIIAIALLLEAGIENTSMTKIHTGCQEYCLIALSPCLIKMMRMNSSCIESLKDDYIVRAKAASYIIDAKPQVERDVAELQKIANLISVDEIHLFDENGYIYSGSLPLYYGYSFDSGEQIAYFKPMLTDKSLTMCQDVTPNTSEKKEVMYAITWNEAGSRMVQIGITPTRLLEEMRQNEISTVVDDMPVYEGMEILVADAKTRVVKGATDNSRTGATLEELNLAL